MLQTLTFLPILGVQLVFLDRNALSALTRRQVHIVKRLLDQRVFTHQAACTVMNLIPDKHSDIILGSSNVSNSEVSESGSGGESMESDSNNICEKKTDDIILARDQKNTREHAFGGSPHVYQTSKHISGFLGFYCFISRYLDSCCCCCCCLWTDSR